MSSLTEIFIQKAINKHGDLYDYSRVNYVKAKVKVSIICQIHGEFLQTPNNHLSGNRCPMCRGRFPANSNAKHENALAAARRAHGDKYNYELVDFSTVPHGKVLITCKIHGPFEQLWGNHVGKHNQNGCPTCAKENRIIKQRLNLADFISKAIAVHDTRYDYSQCQYLGAHRKVDIICPDHGVFQCTPVNHWSNSVGCSKCLHSNPNRGETKIAKWLDAHCIRYTFQKSYPDLYWKSSQGRLKYDFWLPDFNTLIEFDGEHHFLPISWNKSIDGQTRLAEQQTKDTLKTKYAEEHGITLVRIRYDQDIDIILASRFL